MTAPTRSTQAILRRITDTKHANVYTREGVRVMRAVVDQHRAEMASSGLSTHQLFRLAQGVKPSADFKPDPVVGEGPHPPHPEHPIKSVSQAKRILEHLSGQRIIAMSKFKRVTETPAASSSSKHASASDAEAPAANTHTVYAWRWLQELPRDPPPAPAPKREPYGWQVGVGEDRSHLNKRRQRARGPKIRAAVMQWKTEVKPQWLQEAREKAQRRAQATA
ncbi:hypothetical protein EV714DRAFT_250172 [Schizophyllum commune]